MNCAHDDVNLVVTVVCDEEEGEELIPTEYAVWNCSMSDTFTVLRSSD